VTSTVSMNQRTRRGRDARGVGPATGAVTSGYTTSSKTRRTKSRSGVSPSRNRSELIPMTRSGTSVRSRPRALSGVVVGCVGRVVLRTSRTRRAFRAGGSRRGPRRRRCRFRRPAQLSGHVDRGQHRDAPDERHPHPRSLPRTEPAGLAQRDPNHQRSTNTATTAAIVRFKPSQLQHISNSPIAVTAARRA
jgi:hypothetical protein